MIGKSFADGRAESALHLEIDLGDEIDHALLVHAHLVAEVRHLNGAGSKDRLDGGGEIDGRERDQSPLDSFFTIRTSIPPSSARRRTTSSMKLRMKKMPRPLDLSMFSGASGSATSSGSKPAP